MYCSLLRAVHEGDNNQYGDRYYNHNSGDYSQLGIIAWLLFLLRLERSL